MKKKTADPDKLSEKWQQRFKTAENNQVKMFQRYSDWYDAFNARIKTQIAVWRSKPYMPLIAQQTWALVAKFSSLRPGFEVKIRDETADETDLDERAQAAQKKLEYDYDCPYMDETMRDKLASVLIDASVVGTGLAKVTWKTKEVVQRARPVDGETDIADLTKEEVTTKRVGYNDFEPVNIFNVFPSPMTDRLNKGWLILRDFTPIADLKATNDAKGGKFYNNLDKLSGKPQYGDFQTYNRARNRLTDSEEARDDTVDTATIYECYEGKNIYIFGESKDPNNQGGWVLLRQTQNYYWHNKWPVVKFHIKKRPYSFWGQGLAELTYRLNIIFNDVVAHYLDAWNLTNNPSFWAPETANVDDYVVEPGSIVTYQGQTPPSAIQMEKPDPNALQMLLGVIQGSIEGVTASQYALGMPNSATDKTKGTATGIMKLQEAAGDVVSYMRENYTSAILQIGKMWYSNNQQFLDQPVQVITNNNGKKQTTTVKPSDLYGEADIYVDSASMLPKSDEDKRNDALGLNQQLLQLQQASMAQAQQTQMSPLLLNFNELAENVGDGFNHPNIESLLLSDEDIATYHEDKAKEDQQMQNNMGMGLPGDPDQATEQMTKELLAQGQLDPDTLVNGDKNATIQQSPNNY